jgi:hypothetical protein
LIIAFALKHHLEAQKAIETRDADPVNPAVARFARDFYVNKSRLAKKTLGETFECGGRESEKLLVHCLRPIVGAVVSFGIILDY